MANSEYQKSGGGGYASLLKLDAALNRVETSIPFTVSSFVRPIEPGMVVMIGDEIMSLVAVYDASITVKRGCADTIPAEHEAGLIVWIFDAAAVGRDLKEWNAGETIGVKVQPYTVAGALPLTDIYPMGIEFDFRFARPYPPAQMKANAAPWFSNPTVNDATPMLHLTWVHRDRVLQADQLIGHDDGSVGPEPGVTYTMRVYHSVSGALVREETGISGTDFTYPRSQATFDQGQPSDVVNPRFTFTAVRDGIESFQHYEGTFTLTPKYPLDSNYLLSENRVVESPYFMNVTQQYGENAHAYAVAARPSDRQSDMFSLFALNSPLGAADYTPWLTIDYRLPELETIINVRSSSLFDGVEISGDLVGKIALIDDEYVTVQRVISDKQIEVARGCGDSIPAVHAAGARLWFVEGYAAYDFVARDGQTVPYQIAPAVYGPAIPLGQLPYTILTFASRAVRPYPPGRIVVNGRPWFEEAQATSGDPVVFSWARRNRITQGAQAVGHAAPDTLPESGQMTHLSFFYEIPAASPGNPPTVVSLREVDVSSAGIGYAYTYDLALVDGDAAGRALGVCGTVVIQCRISSVRAGLPSMQSYVVPIRVPSYPC
jgi:hypothetical protein